MKSFAKSLIQALGKIANLVLKPNDLSYRTLLIQAAQVNPKRASLIP